MLLVPLFAPAARGQWIDRYFQTSVPSFDQQHGLAELPRSRADVSEPSLHIEGLTIEADLNQSIGEDTNVSGTANGAGSFFTQTAPSLTVTAAGPRGRAGIGLTADDLRYFDLPTQNRTNWTASLGGAYALGRDTIALGYAHLAEHEVATDLGSPASNFAIPFATEDVRALYEARLGRLVVTPNLEFTTFRYGGGAGGVSAQNVQDRDVTTGGVTGLWPIGVGRNVVLVLQDVETAYARSLPAAPNYSSNSVIGLAGLDLRRGGPWEYRLLVGFEARSFSGHYASILAPIAEANAIWTPTGLTTVSTTLSRQIQDAAAAGVGSFVYTSLNAVVDHQLHHNFFLQARFELQVADYQAGGSQVTFGGGASVNWLLSPRLRLRFDYDYRQQGGIAGQQAAEGGLLKGLQGMPAALSSRFAQDKAMLTLRLAL